MTSILKVKAGAVLLDDINLKKDACIHVRDGIIESIESSSTCSNRYIGNNSIIVTPQPANAHIHSADYAFPEYAYNRSLEEAVAEPLGEKHKLLATVSKEALEEAIKNVYQYMWRIGTGLAVDFREGGGIGCTIAKKAVFSLKNDMKVKVLGRPGPLWPQSCDGLGLSTVFAVDQKDLEKLVSKFRPAHVHVSETRYLRSRNDFKIAINVGFDAVVHGTYLEKEDFLLLKEKRVFLILCVRSNLWHSLKVPNLLEIIKLGINIAIGTDNAGLIKPNIWRELETLLLLFRLKGMKSERLAKFLLRALFINGYKSARESPRLIQEGKKAHMLLFDGESSGILRAINMYYALAKRLDIDFLVGRIDSEKTFLWNK